MEKYEIVLKVLKWASAVLTPENIDAVMNLIRNIYEAAEADTKSVDLKKLLVISVTEDLQKHGITPDDIENALKG